MWEKPSLYQCLDGPTDTKEFRMLYEPGRTPYFAKLTLSQDPKVLSRQFSVHDFSKYGMRVARESAPFVGYSYEYRGRSVVLE